MSCRMTQDNRRRVCRMLGLAITLNDDAEVGNFARQHAIEQCCDMWMQRDVDPLPVTEEDDWEF